jgi:hypothetical protein
VEADDLREGARLLVRREAAHLADADGHGGRLHHLADDAPHAPADGEARRGLEARERVREVGGGGHRLIRS